MLFDSHAHINYEDFSKEGREALIEEIEASSLSYSMDIGYDVPSSRLAVEHSKKYLWCFAVVGVHPHDTKKMVEQDLKELRSLSKDAKAIGEIGLDYHYENTDRQKQQLWFREQLRLANELKMPIVIHEREAHEDMYRILKEEGVFSEERASFFPKRKDEKGNLVKDVRVLFHCFAGSVEVAQKYIKEGATISIAGPVTFKNNRKTQEVVRNTPIEYMLVETDMPYLTPEPFRGKKNKSHYVEYVARKVAELKEMSYEDVAEATLKNGKYFFNIV